jgi:hypothetical protein
MRPNLQEEDLVAQNTALYVAQSQAPLSTCSAWTAAQWLRAIVGNPPSRSEGVLSRVRG